MAPLSFPMARFETTTDNGNTPIVSSRLGPVYIAGFVLVGLILVALFTVICVRISRKRALERKRAAPGVTSLPVVRSAVKTEQEKNEPQHDE
jgi:hypothetical protein